MTTRRLVVLAAFVAFAAGVIASTLTGSTTATHSMPSGQSMPGMSMPADR